MRNDPKLKLLHLDLDTLSIIRKVEMFCRSKLIVNIEEHLGTDANRVCSTEEASISSDA